MGLRCKSATGPRYFHRGGPCDTWPLFKQSAVDRKMLPDPHVSRLRCGQSSLGPRPVLLESISRDAKPRRRCRVPACVQLRTADVNRRAPGPTGLYQGNAVRRRWALACAHSPLDLHEASGPGGTGHRQQAGNVFGRLYLTLLPGIPLFWHQQTRGSDAASHLVSALKAAPAYTRPSVSGTALSSVLCTEAISGKTSTYASSLQFGVFHNFNIFGRTWPALYLRPVSKPLCNPSRRAARFLTGCCLLGTLTGSLDYLDGIPAVARYRWSGSSDS